MKSDEIRKSPDAFNVLLQRYFQPYPEVLGIAGSDSLRHIWTGNGDERRLSRITFPKCFSATRSDDDNRIDFGSTLHEMGHFVSLAEHRIVQHGFGFVSGIPELNFQPYNRDPFVAGSAMTEAKAIAWDIIVMRDLFGVECDIRDEVKSLRYTADFLLYEGKGEAAKLEWVGSLVRDYIERYGSISEFDALWHERCQKLPTLMERETCRARLGAHDRVFSEEIEIGFRGWKATIEQFERGDVSTVYVSLIDHDDPDMMTGENFATIAGGRKWVEVIKSWYGPQPEDVQEPALSQTM